MSSGNGSITLGDAIIYLRMSDFRDEDFTTFGEREQQLRDFAAGLGIPAGRIRVAIENDAGNGGFPARVRVQAAGPGHDRDRAGDDADPPPGVRQRAAGPANREGGSADLR